VTALLSFLPLKPRKRERRLWVESGQLERAAYRSQIVAALHNANTIPPTENANDLAYDFFRFVS